MITLVLDKEGHTLHDCSEAQCEVSWDGYNIADGSPADGRRDPDPAVWNTVDDHTVQERG